MISIICFTFKEKEIDMENELQYVVNVRIDELARELLDQNKLQGDLVDAQLKGDFISLYFRPKGLGKEEADTGHKDKASSPGSGGRLAVLTRSYRVPKRARGVRNRMRTRGWPIVGKVKNEYGQNANIYEPFVKALILENLTPTQQRSAVAEILRSNDNTPSDESIDYFLRNTLEFLRGKKEA